MENVKPNDIKYLLTTDGTSYVSCALAPQEVKLVPLGVCGRTILTNLMRNCEKCGVIYQFKCLQADCLDEYTGESRGTFRDRLREHLRALSPTYQYSQTKGHPVDVECFIIMDRQAHGITRTIKEAKFI